MRTDELLKLIKSADEPKWNVPSLYFMTDEALIEELRKRGYTVQKKNTNAVSKSNDNFPMERGVK